jgi:hypothetical protein
MAKRIQVQRWPTQVPLLRLKVQILAKFVRDAGDTIDGLGDEGTFADWMAEHVLHQ